MRPLLSLRLVALALAPWLSAGVVGPAAAAEGPAAVFRLERPRSGPGVDALKVLNGCLRDPDDPSCLDSAFHAGDLIQRLAARDLERAAAPDRPGVAVRYRRIAARGGRLRRDEILTPELARCAPVLAHLDDGGVCDDTGPVPAPAPPRPSALRGLRADLDRGLGERSARRVLCGAADDPRVLEAVVVLAERTGRAPPAFTDLLCRTLTLEEAPALDHGPSGDEAHPAVEAASLAAACIDGTGLACFQDPAPLPGTLARELIFHLAHSPDRRLGALDHSRRQLASLEGRGEWARRAVGARCGALSVVTDRVGCRVEPAPDQTDPELPPSLSPGEAAQARALLALIWGELRELPRRTQRVVCGQGAEVVEAVVVYAERQGKPPVVLDLTCE